MLAGLLPWFSREQGYAGTSVDTQVLATWATSLLPPFLPQWLHPWSPSGFNPLGCQGLFSVLFLAFVIGTLHYRRWALLCLMPAYVLLLVPRLWTPFHQLFLVGPLPTWRYDILLNPLMLLMLASGAGFLWTYLGALWQRADRFIYKGGLVLATALLFGAGLLQHPLLNGELANMPRLAFQREFQFLRENLKAVPPGATIVVPWLPGWEEAPAHDIDVALSVPNAILAYERPDIRWTVMPPEATSLPSQRPLFWFHNSVCSLDLQHPNGTFPPPAQRRFSLLLDQCAAFRDSPALRWVDQQTLSVGPWGGVLQVLDSQISLALGQVKRGY